MLFKLAMSILDLVKKLVTYSKFWISQHVMCKFLINILLTKKNFLIFNLIHLKNSNSQKLKPHPEKSKKDKLWVLLKSYSEIGVFLSK